MPAAEGKQEVKLVLRKKAENACAWFEVPVGFELAEARLAGNDLECTFTREAPWPSTQVAT